MIDLDGEKKQMISPMRYMRLTTAQLEGDKERRAGTGRVDHVMVNTLAISKGFT